MSIVRSRKSKRSIVILLMICFLFSACQPTPDQEAIAEKDAEKLESRIAESKGEENKSTINSGEQTTEKQSSEESGPFETIAEPIVKAFSVQDEYEGADPEVKVSIDAQGTYQAENIPVLRVKPKMFTMEEIKAWAETLSVDGIYLEPKTQLTKAEIEKHILNLKSWSTDDYLEKVLGYKDEESKELERKALELEIEKYESMYESAPEQVVTVPTDWTFHETGYYLSQGFAEGKADIDNNFVVDLNSALGTGRLYVNELRDGDYYKILMSFSVYSGLMMDGAYTNWDTKLEQPMTISEEEARNKGETLLKEMGIMDFVCSGAGKQSAADENGHRKTVAEDAEEPVYRYNLRFHRQCGTVESLSNKLLWNPKDIGYGAKYEYEELYITIVNNEIFSITWSAPLEVIGVENSDVKTISFEEACDACKKQMQTEYTLGKMTRIDPMDISYKEELEKLKGAEIHINDVTFGMTRIQIKDNMEEFRLVPAWRFSGAELQDWGDGCDWSAGYEQRYIYQTINAIDGTYIDLTKGY